MFFKSGGKQWKQDVLIYFGCHCLCLYATLCSPKLRILKHFCSSQLPGLLILPMLKFVLLFIQQTLMHPKKGQEWEKKCVNRKFPRLDWDHRSPQRISWAPTPVQSSIMHRFSGRGGSSGHRLFFLGEFANVCKLPWRWCPRGQNDTLWWGFPKRRTTGSICPRPRQHIKENRSLGLTSGHWLRISRDKGYLSSATVDSYHQASLGSSPQGTSKPWNFQREP